MAKNNHEQVVLFITQAIQSCSYDSTLSETKSYLAAALQSVNKVAKKRTRNLNNQKEIKSKHNEWWDMLKENAKKNIDLENIQNNTIIN